MFYLGSSELVMNARRFGCPPRQDDIASTFITRFPSHNLLWHPLYYNKYRLQGLLGPEIILVRGLVKLDPAVAYHNCLNLPATFSQPRTIIISGPSTEIG